MKPFLSQIRKQDIKDNAIPLPILTIFLLLVFLIPLETLGKEANATSLTVASVAGYALIASCMWRPGILFRRPHVLTFMAFSMMLVALGVTLIINQEMFEYAARRFFTWCQLLVFFHIAQSVVANVRHRFYTIVFFVAGAVVAAVLMRIGLGINVVMADINRSSLGNFDPNYQATVLGLAAVWALTMTLDLEEYSSVIRYPVGMSIFAVLMTASMSTGSRGGFLALSVCAVPAVFFRPVRNNKVVRVVVFSLLILSIFLFLLHDENMMTRIQKTFYERDMANRGDIYISAIDLWVKRPTLGWGLGANEYALGGYENVYLLDTHNIFLYVLTAGGIVGVIVLAYILIGSLKSALAIPDRLTSRLAVIGLVFIITASLSVTILFLKCFWLAIALAVPLRPLPFRAIGWQEHGMATKEWLGE